MLGVEEKKRFVKLRSTHQAGRKNVVLDEFFVNASMVRLHQCHQKLYYLQSVETEGYDFAHCAQSRSFWLVRRQDLAEVVEVFQHNVEKNRKLDLFETTAHIGVASEQLDHHGQTVLQRGYGLPDYWFVFGETKPRKPQDGANLPQRGCAKTASQ
jgi:hypothetical protein